MIDTPKAIHFIAKDENGELHSHNPVGLNCRWDVAAQLEGINMLRLSECDRRRIEEVLARTNKRLVNLGVTIELAQTGKPCSLG